jgi:hypothetical protein
MKQYSPAVVPVNTNDVAYITDCGIAYEIHLDAAVVAARLIAAKFQLPPDMAAVVASLANLGGRP